MQNVVIDLNGEIIPGLYCGGESAGGFSQHGLARAVCQGYVAGNAAAAAPRLEVAPDYPAPLAAS